MEQVEINGLLWDTENVEINGEKYFTWEQAMNIAKILGKRLPTREEMKSIFEDGYIWDNEKKGFWNNVKKLFFPAWGIMAKHHGDEPYQKGKVAHIWTSEESESVENTAYLLNGYPSAINIILTPIKNRVPVRLVQDMPKNMEEDCNSSTSWSISFEKIDYFINLEKRIKALEQDIKILKAVNIPSKRYVIDHSKFISEVEETTKIFQNIMDMLKGE